MTPQQTAAVYDKIGHHWASDSFNACNGIAQHERALQFAPTTGHAIDIGCGSSGRIIDLLLAHGYRVEGLDISTEMIALARQKHPAITFHHADLSSWKFPRAYDFISAWDSIWHLPLADQENTLQKLCAALKPGGIMIFTSGGVDTPGDVTNPCLGEPLYHAALGIPALLRHIDNFGCICRHLEYDQHPESHLYLIIQRPAYPPPPQDNPRTLIPTLFLFIPYLYHSRNPCPSGPHFPHFFTGVSRENRAKR